MDYIIRAMDKEGKVKISSMISTGIVEEARKTHGLSKSTSAALGRTLTMGAIIADWQKDEEDSVTINIKGDGPIGRIVVTGKNNGKIKGYVLNPEADLPIRESDGKIDVSGLVGNGTLTVVEDLGLKEPYVGKVNLVSGEIAEDFAHYLYTSAQVPSVVSLGVLVDIDYTIKAAGGFVLELLPGAGEEIISKIEENLRELKSVTELITDGLSAEEIIKKVLKGFEIKILEKKEVVFECDCSREKVISALYSLGEKELTDMIEEDGKANVRCEFCNTEYDFTREELEEIKNDL